MKTTPFFHFLLYIISIIIIYAIVTNIGKRVHEKFEEYRVPNSPSIILNISKNVNEFNPNQIKLKIYVNDPKRELNVTHFGIKCNDANYLFVFNELKSNNLETAHIATIDYIVEENTDLNITSYFINKYGKSPPSKTIKITAKELEEEKKIVSDEEFNASIEETESQVVSCHPNGTYTIGKQCIYTPGLMTNLEPEMYETLKKELQPKDKTYTVDFNLDL